MKKVLSLLLTLAMVATFVGCGNAQEPASAAPTEEAAPAEEAAPTTKSYHSY